MTLAINYICYYSSNSVPKSKDENGASSSSSITKSKFVMSPKANSMKRKRHRSLANHPPESLGSDAEAVQWVNRCFRRLFSDAHAVLELRRIWLEAMKEYNRNLPSEVSFHIRHFIFLWNTVVSWNQFHERKETLLNCYNYNYKALNGEN